MSASAYHSFSILIWHRLVSRFHFSISHPELERNLAPSNLDKTITLLVNLVDELMDYDILKAPTLSQDELKSLKDN